MSIATLHRGLLACLALVCLGIASCATPMSKAECMATDWRTIGYEDGAAGHPGSRISVHRRACGEHGVAPDFNTYQAGRNEGLVEFCSAANGYRFGVAGGEYAGVCPIEREEDFLRGFAEGRALHAMRERVRSTDVRLGAQRRELEQLEKAVVRRTAVAVDEATSREDRVTAVADTAKLSEQIGKLKGEIEALEKDLAYHRQELDDYLAVQ